MNPTKVLMTGASGFVGRHLLALLEPDCFDVYHLVRKSRGLPQEFVWDFGRPLPEGLPSCEVVVHLAAQVDFSHKIKATHYMVNTVAAARLAKYCLETGASLIVASMTGVHGSASFVSPRSGIAPENSYALSKFLAEEIVRIFAPEAIILRICGIYGLDGPAHLGLNTAISEAVHRQVAPVLVGPGRAKRNYICVTDVAKWIYHLIAQGTDRTRPRRKDPACDMFYLAGPETLTIEQYLQAIAETFLPGKDLTHSDGPEGADYVVEASLAPFPLSTFREYLASVKEAIVRPGA